MTFQSAQPKKRKDDELLILTILAAIFTGFLVYFDFRYSSIGAMALIAQAAVWIGQIGLAALWVLVFGKWQDPNYDNCRRWAFMLSVILVLIVGIHHATTREDNQVIIDSKENAAKDSIK
jgi:cell division protein FtsW (lipid II flippase)